MPGTELRDGALMLIRLGSEAGGRVDPERIARRKPDSRSRRAFDWAQEEGWLDGEGWLTPIAKEALDAPA